MSACALTWLGDFDTAIGALSFVCEKRRAFVAGAGAVVPSHIRWVVVVCFRGSVVRD
jgi:hypothetical protein